VPSLSVTNKLIICGLQGKSTRLDANQVYDDDSSDSSSVSSSSDDSTNWHGFWCDTLNCYWASGLSRLDCQWQVPCDLQPLTSWMSSILC